MEAEVNQTAEEPARTVKAPKTRDKRVYLKVKLKTLAEEAKIIRMEEARQKDISFPAFVGLTNHRKKDLRPEARSSMLAYILISGKPYEAAEPKAYTEPDWTRIRTLARKFGTSLVAQNLSVEQAVEADKSLKDRIETWLGSAKTYYKDTRPVADPEAPVETAE